MINDGQQPHPEGEFEPANDGLSPIEEIMIERVLAGEIADLDGATVRASVVQRLLTGITTDSDAAHAIRIRRGAIDGVVDLEGCEIQRAVLLANIRILGNRQRGSLIIRDAKCRRFSLQNCTLDGPLVADRSDLTNGLFIGGGEIGGSIKLRGARVGGAFAVEGTKLGDGASGVLGNGIEVIGPVVLRRARSRGQIALARARLGSGLNAESLKVRSEPGEASLILESCQMRGDLNLRDGAATGSVQLTNADIAGSVTATALRIEANGLDATGAEIGQGVDISAAEIAGPVLLDSSRVAKDVVSIGAEVDGGEIAVSANNAIWKGDAVLTELKAVGEVRLSRATLGGRLDLSGARVFGSGSGVCLDGLRATGGVSMQEATIVGRVSFVATRFADEAILTGATIKVERGIALDARGCRCSRDIKLDGAFNTIGAVVADDAEVSGQMDLSGSRIKSVAITRGVSDRTSARGQAHTASVVEFEETAVAHDETAISLVAAKVGCLVLPDRAEQRPRGIVDLSRAHVGNLIDHEASWPPVSTRSFTMDGRDIDHLVLDGLVYDHLQHPAGARSNAPQANGATARGVIVRSQAARPGVGRARLRWLAGQAARDTGADYKPQPYVQLSRQLQAQGHRDAARDITIAGERAARRAASATSADRWQNRLRDWLALYGFNPWRTVLWMVAVILFCASLFGWAATLCAEAGCHDETILIATAQDRYSETGLGRGYPDFNALAYSIDAFFPMLDLGYDSHWRFNGRFGTIATVPVPSSSALLTLMSGGEPESLIADVKITLGSLLYVLVLLERLLGVVLAAVALTAFTGLMTPRR